MRAALDQGVERIVYTSSVATLRASNGPVLRSMKPRLLVEGGGVGSYKKSKVLAERLEQRMIAEQGVAGGNRQSVNHDRTSGRSPHPDGPNPDRGRLRTDSRFRQHRPESGPCR